MNSRRFRLILAWVMLAATLVGWPVSVWMTDEPVFILSLSWLALTLTAYDIICSTELKDK